MEDKNARRVRFSTTYSMGRMGRLFPAIIQIREDIRGVRDIRCVEEGGNWHCVVWKRMVGNNALIGGLQNLPVFIV